MSRKRKQVKALKVSGRPRSKVAVVSKGRKVITGNIGFAQYTRAATRPKLSGVCLSIAAKAIRKMQFWLEQADGEFAGFGFCGNVQKPLRITDFILLDQRTGGAHADLDDMAVGLYYNDMAEMGLEPVQYGRIWFHTHPFGLTQPSPSGGDDHTFERAFGDCNWAVMLVFSNNAMVPYAEIQAPGSTPELRKRIMNRFELNIEIEPNVTKAEAAKWGAEFDTHVKKLPRTTKGGKKGKVLVLGPLNPTEREYLDNLEADIQEARENIGLTIAEQEYEQTVQRISSGVHIR